jgi:hypothetical protein
MAAAHVRGDVDGKTALKAMICIDEIRGRLSEVNTSVTPTTVTLL